MIVNSGKLPYLPSNWNVVNTEERDVNLDYFTFSKQKDLSQEVLDILEDTVKGMT